jgi:hypothetical protein
MPAFCYLEPAFMRSSLWRCCSGMIVGHRAIADDQVMMRQPVLIPDTLPAGKLVVPPKE